MDAGGVAIQTGWCQQTLCEVMLYLQRARLEVQHDLCVCPCVLCCEERACGNTDCGNTD